MKNMAVLLGIFMLLLWCTDARADGWDRCKTCHRDSGSPAPSKAALIQKYKTGEALVKGALSTKTQQMEFVRYNPDLIVDAAVDIGIPPKGMSPKGTAKAEMSAPIDAKAIVETRCTTCHNINRIVYAPKATLEDWLHIISRMQTQVKGLLTPQEMTAVVEWLYARHDTLKPVDTGEPDSVKKLPEDVRQILVKNRCLTCHTDDRIIKQAAAWTEKEWEHVIERMRSKAPELLKDVNVVSMSSHLYNRLAVVPKTGAKKIASDLYYLVDGYIDVHAENKHRYYFNDKLDKDQGQRGLDGFVEGDAQVHGEVFSPDKWKTRLSLAFYGMADPGNDAMSNGMYRRISRDVKGFATIEELWAEVNATDSLVVRAGVQEYTSDLIGSVYKDTDLGVRVYGKLSSGIDWSLYAAQRVENDLLSGYNSPSDLRDQQIVIAHMQFTLASQTVKPSLSFNHDREGDHKFGRAGKYEKVDVVYPGVTTYGDVGPFKLLTGLYGAFGMQRDVVLLGKIPLQDQKVSAFAGYFDLALPLGMFTPHLGFLYVSGDDNPLDDKAHGFDAISERVDVWGAHGIVINDRISLPGGLTVVRDHSPYTSLRDRDASSNFVNPGGTTINLGLIVNPIKQLTIDTNLTYFWWNETEVLEAVVGPLGKNIGLEWNADISYDINKHFTVYVAGAAFWPDEDMSAIYGNHRMASDVLAGVKYRF
ncbi:hypothetical protein [Candidatus Magnetobacterium casense]|uniref:Cytochrome c domain-containing protein n=1 Tax=Candidatus Magnetobacterium casense TaxID=1455061 RepID=A0ABS6RZ46_9BACT|nr:hypothetical protein [Candidatus Magnetobacterium casensis]MBV6341927.1 hypothetical protein [Candidatus Magnetobacterium casensis]